MYTKNCHVLTFPAFREGIGSGSESNHPKTTTWQKVCSLLCILVLRKIVKYILNVKNFGIPYLKPDLGDEASAGMVYLSPLLLRICIRPVVRVKVVPGREGARAQPNRKMVPSARR
jgi:hypothetical protein